MLNLTYSNRTEDLLKALAEALRAEREQWGVWEPIRLVVPNPNVRRYLLDGLSKSLGILANFEVDYLDGLWQTPLKQMQPRVQLWNRHALQGAILSVLSGKQVLESEDLTPLKDYLQGEGADLKRLQLAEKMGALFEDYSLTRHGWSRSWAKNASVTGAPVALETWQRGLWNRILAASGDCTDRWTTLAELIMDGSFDAIPLPPRIHVFGLSYTAEIYHRAFQAAAYRKGAESVDVMLYTLNPCQEYWDDLPSEKQIRREAERLGQDRLPTSGEDPYALETNDDPLLLRRWGRAGRENIRLLNEITDCTFNSAFQDPPQEPCTLLEGIQDNLRFRKSDPPGSPDASIRILACPSPAREAEVVASEIWQLMEQAPADRPLRFSDIAVVVPPNASLRTAYIDHLRMAFDATGHIPMVVVDAPTPSLATLLDGADLLLDLPTGRASRRDILKVLSHPAVRARFPDTDAKAWAHWANAAGIVRGVGPEHLKDEVLLEPGILHWEQGLERLALSAFLPPTSSWSGEDFDRPSAYSGDFSSTAVFVARASSLVQRVWRLREDTASPAEWAAQISTYLLSYLGGEEAGDVSARAQLAKSLRRLHKLVPEGMPLPELNYRQARELAKQAIAGIRGDAGGRPHQGVVVGSYAPMRALPFRAVILTGLGEGQFPSPEENQPLDLRIHAPKPGDVSTAQRDRYLFLEMLLGARETVRLTYSTEEPITRETRLPSSLVQDLVQSLAPITLQMLRQDHPRYRFDPVYFPEDGNPTLRSLSPTALDEAKSRAAGSLLVPAIPGLANAPWSNLKMPDDLRQGLDALLHPLTAPPAGKPSKPTLTLRLHQLRSWLECPVQGTARVRLHLRDEEEDLADLEEEVLGTTKLTQAVLRKEVLLKVARNGLDLDATYQEIRAGYLRSGSAAPGIFGEPEVQVDLALLRLQLKALQGGKPALVRFGPSMNPDDESFPVFPPLELEVTVHDTPIKVRLIGSLQPQLDGRSLFMTPKAGVAAQGGIDSSFRLKVLRGYLDHHLLAAVSAEATPHGILGIAGNNSAGKRPGAYRSIVDFHPLKPEDALKRLSLWITELLQTEDPRLLPIEAIMKGEHVDRGTLQEWIQEMAHSPRDFSAFKTGPLRQAERNPVDLTPLETATRRLDDFLAQSSSGNTVPVP